MTQPHAHESWKAAVLDAVGRWLAGDGADMRALANQASMYSGRYRQLFEALGSVYHAHGDAVSIETASSTLAQRGEADVVAFLMELTDALPEGSRPGRDEEAHRLIYEPPPLHVLPETLRNFVAEASDALSVDPTMVLLPTLALCGAAIGTTRLIELKSSWREYPILWTCVVAESGTGKSPSLDAVLRLIKRLRQEADGKWADALAKYERDRRQYEAKCRTQRSKKAPIEDPGSPPDPPPRKRFTVADVTPEALGRILADNPRGTLVAMDELAGWLDFDRYRGSRSPGAAAPWLSAWSAGRWEVDRVSRGVIIVEQAAVSVVGGIQPGVLRRTLGDGEHVEDGLLARLLMAAPPSRPRPWTEASIRKAVFEEMEDLVARLHTLEHAQDLWVAEGGAVSARNPHILPLEPGARTCWVHEHDLHEVETRDLAGAAAAREAKFRSYAARFALILRLLEDPSAASIDERAMVAGWALAHWARREAARVYAMHRLVEGDEHLPAKVAKLVAWIQGRGGRASARDLSRSGPRPRPDAEAARAMLEDLVKRGLGRWQPLPAPEAGRPPESVFVLRGPATRGQPRPDTSDSGEDLV